MSIERSAVKPSDSQLASLSSNLFSYLLLALLVGVVFGTSYGFEFLRWDDPVYVTGEPMVQRGLTLEGIAWAFSDVHATNYHPLTWLSLMADVSLFGVSAAAMHLVNVALHGINTLLLFLVLQKMTGQPGKALAVAALFALHPLHVEVVVWVSQRKELLATLFGLITMLLYLYHVRRPSPIRFAGVVIPFLLTLLCKPTWITLPLLLILVDYWPMDRLHRTDRSRWVIGEKAVLLAVSGLITIVTIWAQEYAIGNVRQSATIIHYANIPIDYFTYMYQTLLPFNLSHFYPDVNDVSILRLIGCTLLIIVASVASWHFRGQAPWLISGWLWFLVSLVPVIGFIKVGEQAHADRYMYMPIIGLFICIVWTIDYLIKQRVVKVALMVGSVLVLGALSRAQVEVWRNDISLYSHAVEVDPGNTRALRQLSALLELRNEDEAAEFFANLLLTMIPEDCTGHFVLSMVAMKRNQCETAIFHAQSALEADADWWYAYQVIARCAFLTGQDELARNAVNQLIEQQPDRRREWEQLIASSPD